MTLVPEIKKILNAYEFREILNFIETNYALSLKHFNQSILKHRIEILLHTYNIEGIENFKKLISKEKMFQNLLKCIYVETSGLFRDVELWQKIKEMFSKFNELNICVGDITSDDEVFSLLILLNELNFENYKITSTTQNIYNIERLHKNTLSQKKIDTGIQYFKKLFPDSDLLKYFEITNLGYIFKNKFLKNIEFEEHSFLNSYHKKNFDFVFFRNRLIYYDYSFVDTLLANISEIIPKNRYLILGTKEKIYSPLQFKLEEVDKELKIYKKL